MHDSASTEPRDNQTVSLGKIQNTIIVPTANATTDISGNYTFENLTLGATYRVSLLYQGVPYSSDLSLTSQTSVQVDFTVYETTTEDIDIKIRMINLVIVLEEGRLRIFEDAVYVNRGLRVFNNSRLEAWLPSGLASFKTSVMDCCVQRLQDNVLFDPMDPIKPNGTYYMWMEYNITISSSVKLFEKKLAYDTEQFFLIIEDNPGVTADITAGLSNKSRTVEFDNGEYTVFNSTNLNADSTVSVRFTGLPTPKDFQLTFLWLIIPLVLGIGFLTYPIVRKRSSEEKTYPQDLKAQKTRLFEELAKLDSGYAAGEISKKKYEKLKAERKMKVITIIQQTEQGKVSQLTPPVAPSPLLMELHAEEQALISTLHKLDVDHKKGLVSAESHRKMKIKFERRRAEVVKKIKKLEKTERTGS